MSTTTTMSKTNVTFTREQKNFLDEFLSSKVKEYVDAIMEDDDEDTTEDYLMNLSSKFFTTKGFKVGKVTDKKTRAKKTGPKAPSNSYILFSNAEGRERSKNQLTKKFTKELKGMDSDSRKEKYDGETDTEAILKKLVTSKLIISNAAKLWKVHKEDEDSTYQKYQDMYLKNKAEYQNLLSENKSSSSNEETVEEVEVEVEVEVKPPTKKGKAKTSSKTGLKVSDFESYDGLTIHPNMKIRGAATTKNKGKKFSCLEDAVDAMNEDDETMSIMRNNKGNFTLHSSQKMTDSGEGGSAEGDVFEYFTWTKDDEEE
jgi:hypothetical protein